MGRELTHLSLFSGIGGLDLAAEMAGMRTIGQCEWADYPRAVLEKHWPNLPRWRDIRTLTKESFYEKTGLRTVDVISGGFPCQPFSVAGKRGGKDDDRYLWPEMLRVIRELQPTWVIGENVPGIVNLALDTVSADLEAEGYETQCFIIPACGVDAPHKRYRVAIVAHAINRSGAVRRNGEFSDAEADGRKGPDHRRGEEGVFAGKRRKDESANRGVADGVRTEVYGTDSDAQSICCSRSTDGKMLDAEFTNCSSREREREAKQVPRATRRASRTHSAWENWPAEPDVGRVADGIPNRVDRLKCLGNAVVPQQFYPIFEAIAEIEKRGKMNEQQSAKTRGCQEQQASG